MKTGQIDPMVHLPRFYYGQPLNITIIFKSNLINL